MKGYKLILVMPESMSIERRRLMQAYGATFDLTPKEKGMKGAIARAAELAAELPGAWVPQQFENPANIAIHAKTTAQEILADFSSKGKECVKAFRAFMLEHGGEPTRVAEVVCDMSAAFLAAAVIAARAEYAEWLDALPESLRDSATARALQAIVDLDLEELAAIVPPRGYGRD